MCEYKRKSAFSHQSVYAVSVCTWETVRNIFISLFILHKLCIVWNDVLESYISAYKSSLKIING